MSHRTPRFELEPNDFGCRLRCFLGETEVRNAHYPDIDGEGGREDAQAEGEAFVERHQNAEPAPAANDCAVLAPETDLAIALRKLLLAIPLGGAALAAVVAEANAALIRDEQDRKRDRENAVRYAGDLIAKLIGSDALHQVVVSQQASFCRGWIGALFCHELIGHADETRLLFDLDHARASRSAQLRGLERAAVAALAKAG